LMGEKGCVAFSPTIAVFYYVVREGSKRLRVHFTVGRTLNLAASLYFSEERPHLYSTLH